MLLSPESLIADITLDKPLPFDLPPLIKRMLKSGAKSRPGYSVTQPLLDTETNFYLPLHPPRLALEYLERCGLLFAECSRLRDRIEALQLDIFNLDQAVRTHQADGGSHSAMRDIWEAQRFRLLSQKSEGEAAKKLVEQSIASFDKAMRDHPTATDNADGAWMAVYRNIEKNRLKGELAAATSAIDDIDYQMKALELSRERSQERWHDEMLIFGRKKNMLGVGGGIALETRLGGALHRYSSLMRDLKEYMFSAEWGLEHIFGVWDETPWGDLDVDAYADENVDVPLDGLGERLIRLSNAAYGFQLLEHAYAVSVRVDLAPGPEGWLTGKLELPLPEDTSRAYVRRIRARGPAVRSVSVVIEVNTPFRTRANRGLPDWITKDSSPADIALWEPGYRAAVEAAAAIGLSDMTATIALGQLCSTEGASEGYVTDRTMSYTSAAGEWQVSVTSPDQEKILADGLWLDVIASRTTTG